MGYTFCVSVFGQQKHAILEINPCDFLKLLTIQASISYELYSYGKIMYCCQKLMLDRHNHLEMMIVLDLQWNLL